MVMKVMKEMDGVSLEIVNLKRSNNFHWNKCLYLFLNIKYLLPNKIYFIYCFFIRKLFVFNEVNQFTFQNRVNYQIY